MCSGSDWLPAGHKGDFKSELLHLKLLAAYPLMFFKHLTADMNNYSDNVSQTESKNFRKKKISSYVFAVISIFFICVIVLLGHRWNGSRIIKSFTITGNNYLSYQEISDLVDTLIINKTQDKISLSKIQQKLNSYPFILSSLAMFSDLETISIEVTERLPKLILSMDSNYYFLMDDLSIHPLRKFEKPLIIPIVQNFTLESSKDSVVLKNVISFVDEVNADSKLKNSIVKINLIKGKEELGIYLRGIGFSIKTKLKNSLIEELNNVGMFLGSEYFQKTNDKIDYIDARWNDKLYVMEKY